MSSYRRKSKGLQQWRVIDAASGPLQYRGAIRAVQPQNALCSIDLDEIVSWHSRPPDSNRLFTRTMSAFSRDGLLHRRWHALAWGEDLHALSRSRVGLLERLLGLGQVVLKTSHRGLKTHLQLRERGLPPYGHPTSRDSSQRHRHSSRLSMLTRANLRRFVSATTPPHLPTDTRSIVSIHVEALILVDRSACDLEKPGVGARRARCGSATGSTGRPGGR
jgi:hypothetical protein